MALGELASIFFGSVAWSGKQEKALCFFSSEGDSELLGNYLSAFCLNQLLRIKASLSRKRIFMTFFWLVL